MATDKEWDNAIAAAPEHCRDVLRQEREKQEQHAADTAKPVSEKGSD